MLSYVTLLQIGAALLTVSSFAFAATSVLDCLGCPICGH
jgi:hypothetical protein